MANTPTLTTLPLLFTDIETIPTQDPVLIAEIEAKLPLPILDLAGIKADGRLKDEAKIEADIAAKREKAAVDHEVALAKRLTDIDEAYRKTALDGGKGHIASIAWAFDDDVVVALDNEELQPLTLYEDTEGEEHDVTGQGVTLFTNPENGSSCLSAVKAGEEELLTKFFGEIEETLDVWAESDAHAEWKSHEPGQLPDGSWQLNGKFVDSKDDWISERTNRQLPVLVAHYAGFDIRFIWQRAIALGVQVPAWWPVNASKYATDKVQDTMTMWAGHGNRISLDALCRALGIPGKTDLDGSGVWDAVKAGRIDDAAEYNRCDVRSLRSVHRRMRGLKPLLIDIDPVAEDLYLNGGDLDNYVVGQIMDAVPLDFANATNAAGNPAGWEA